MKIDFVLPVQLSTVVHAQYYLLISHCHFLFSGIHSARDDVVCLRVVLRRTLGSSVKMSDYLSLKKFFVPST